MQMEIELKARIANKKRLLQRFSLLGIRLIKRHHLLDIYYSPEKGKRLIGNNPKFRIRKNLTTGTASLDYHIPKGKYAAEEHEIDISDGSMMDVILKNLKFKEEARVDKVRSKYIYRDFNIDVDEVKELGFFIEVELMNVKNKKKAVQRIKSMLFDLGLSEDNEVHERYLEMMLSKKRKA